MFYDNLVTLCEQNNTTPLALRKELNIPHPTMASWKRSGATPRKPVLNKIADHFHTTPDKLTKQPTKKTEPNQEKLLELFNHLNATGQRTAVSRLNELTQIKRYSA